MNNNNFYIKLILLVIIIIQVYFNGLNLSTEFTGGTLIEIQINSYVSAHKCSLEKLFDSDKVKIIYKVNDNYCIIFNIPINKNIKEIIAKIKYFCATNNITLKIKKIDYIGSEFSKNLFLKSIVAIILSLITISIYINFRFEYKFSIGALFSLFHDFIVLLAVFSCFQIEFNLSTLSSMVAVLGYSINDTIVIFDRIRNNINQHNKNTQNIVQKIQLVNTSINQTLSRTILTALLTLISSIIILIFGGTNLFSFAFAFSVGILIGTYSSIYIASMIYILF